MPELWIDTATADLLKDVAKSEFLMDKQVGQTLSLTLWRDDEGDGSAVAIGPQDILVVVPEGGSTRRGAAAQITTNTGELRKEAPFNVKNGDRFTLPETFAGLGGVSCYVSEPPVDVGPYISAPFVAEG